MAKEEVEAVDPAAPQQKAATTKRKVIQKLGELPEHDAIISGQEGATVRLALSGDTAEFVCALVKILDADGNRVHPDKDQAREILTEEWQDLDYKAEVRTVVTERFGERNKKGLGDFSQRVLGLIGANRLADIRTLYGTKDVIHALHEGEQHAAETAGTMSEEDASEAINTFDRIGREAIKMDVSDIHFEIFPNQATLLYRLDGDLTAQRNLPPKQATAICQAVYNTLAEIGSTKDSFNPRRHQQAVIDRTYSGIGRVRYRFQSVPVAPDGVSVVMRILLTSVSQPHKSYRELGYSNDQSELIERAFGRASGITIIAGTTGSGKSTTLKNATESIHMERPHWNLCSIEEPVEYQIKGCRQTPVVREEDKDGQALDLAAQSKPFVDTLKSLMRADPDFILVGEVRDRVTAELTIQASQTGHQVATTLHADSWIGIVERLKLMGVPYGSIGQPGLLSALMYQKLMPVLCPECRVPIESYECSPEQIGTIKRLRKLTSESERNGIYVKGKGCAKCKGKGTIGRTICSEVALVDDSLRREISAGNVDKAIEVWRSKRTSEDGDMTGRWAAEHAAWKMKQGMISPFAVESHFKFLDEFMEDH